MQSKDWIKSSISRADRLPVARACGIAVFCGILLLTTACQRRAPAPSTITAIDPHTLDGQRAFTEVANFIAIGPRASGTEGAERAAHYLHERLRALAIPAELDCFHESGLTFRNVLGRLDYGRTNWIVLASHFDTKSGIAPDFIGANDSGSSTGLLLALAHVLSTQTNLSVNIMLAFLDGEECRWEYGASDGLHGSRRLARRLANEGFSKNVRAAVILDMIGDRDLTLTMPKNVTPALAEMFLHAAAKAEMRHYCRLAPYPILDDHQPFLEHGMPALVIIDFHYGTAPERNDYWHTTADTLDKLSSKSLEHVGRLVLSLLNEIFAKEQSTVCK